MVSFNFLILIPLITATRRFNGLSYRSKVVEGDKPILRMSPNADYAESNSDEGRQSISSPETKDQTTRTTKTTTTETSLVRDMDLLVKWLMENFSYDVVPLHRKSNNVAREGGKPILRLAPSDTSDSDSDEDNDKVEITEPQPLTENPVKLSEETPLEPPVDPPVDHHVGPQVNPPVDPSVKPAVEPSVKSENSDGALRMKHKTKTYEEEPRPVWVKDLKAYIKDLTTRYGQQEVLEQAKPVIASLEKKHNMKIKDIDVDEYGEIHISYIEKGKGKKTVRKRKQSEET